MKKRILCLLLGAIMILFCFAGCAEKNDIEVKEKIGEEASEGAVSLSMFLMSEKEVSDAQEELMEAAVNKITEAKYKIRLDLTFVKADEYYDTLDERLENMQEFYDQLQKGEVTKKTEKPVYVDKDGLPQVYYPLLQDYDVDIFYFGGVDKYNQYMEEGYLAKLTEEFDGSSKALKSVINSEILSAFKAINGNNFYAVPTNCAIGEYKYLLLNKKALAATQYSKDDIKSLTSEECKDMLSQIDMYWRDQFVPIYSSGDGLDLHGVEYFDFDSEGFRTGEFSILGGSYDVNRSDAAVKVNKYTPMGNILSSDAKNQINTLKGYEFAGYYAEEGEENKPFAVGCITGNARDVMEYQKDYEIVTLETPTIMAEDLYANMFGVTAKSNSLAASMKVITLLNTNEEFRNLILYGVEGENYVWAKSKVLDENGLPYDVIERLEKNPKKIYTMSALKTGNVALTYTEKREDPLEKKMMLEHNKNIKSEFIIGFSFHNEFTKENSEMPAETKAKLLEISEFSKEAYKKIKDAKDQAALDAVFDEINAVFADPTSVTLLTGSGAGTANALYIKWLSSKGLHNSMA